jgi:crotonobetainyl-CoA:carnitine CoA-transferase CaiB-like acyl-CoA transferase
MTTEEKTMSAPLEGVRVLDFSRVLAGPFATMHLADLGADVVKVERPEFGDDTRSFGPPFSDGVSTYFLSINRGKRSICLDLKDPGDREIAMELSDQADVVIENFRPGVMERLGLGPEVLRGRNPRLVYCSIRGFGRDVARAGYDLVIQGMGGIPSITGAPDGAPAKCGASIADLVTGLYGVQGILAALFRRERTGKGALVDVPMIDGQVAMLTYHASGLLNGGATPTRLGNHHPSIHPYGSYRAADGFLNIAIGNDRLFKVFAQTMGQPEWEQDTRFAKNVDRVAHRGELDAMIGGILGGGTVQAWCDLFLAAGVPAGPINTVAEALEQVELVEHAHPSGKGRVRTAPLPFRVDGAPRAAALPPPVLGAHTEAVLKDWLKGR